MELVAYETAFTYLLTKCIVDRYDLFLQLS
jgi:hypothetical protein